ncbi:sugar transferase [Kocuria rosea]|nr:sugar transferase [Kocuria rosea]
MLALIVKRHDGGPVLTAQERTGLDGLPFTMLNFRSVAPDVEECRAALRARSASQERALLLMRSGPRVTGPGTWMRRHGLDQLPQLVNVLRGEMSLVGPRPPLPSEEIRYDEHVRRRLRLRPGITGPWQVPGLDDSDREQAVRLDLHYVETWSPVQDLLILLRTVKAMVAREGAY